MSEKFSKKTRPAYWFDAEAPSPQLGKIHESSDHGMIKTPPAREPMLREPMLALFQDDETRRTWVETTMQAELEGEVAAMPLRPFRRSLGQRGQRGGDRHRLPLALEKVIDLPKSERGQPPQGHPIAIAHPIGAVGIGSDDHRDAPLLN